MKKRHRHILYYFTPWEWGLFVGSVALILCSFFLFDGKNPFTLAASLIGVSSLLLNAKGNPVGQALMVLFSLLYGFISYSFSYYGEMITYLGMTAPMALFSLLSWLAHPYEGNRATVEINRLKRAELWLMLFLTAVVTGLFYLILDYFHTANLALSTLSVTTSFAAVYLTFRRSPYFALAYAANDLVLIALWILASLNDPAYLSVIVCFLVFLFNDLYGFFSWKRMERAQKPSRR